MSNIDTMDLIELEDRQLHSLDLSVNDLLVEWEDLIEELSEKEIELTYLKQKIFEKEQIVINETDFKAVYGKNNADVRKTHLLSLMKTDYENRNTLELSVDWINRRISFIRELVKCKREIIVSTKS